MNSNYFPTFHLSHNPYVIALVLIVFVASIIIGVIIRPIANSKKDEEKVDDNEVKINISTFPLLNIPNYDFIKKIESTDKYVKFTTAFLDRHRDYIVLYLIKNGDSFQLTDDGFLFMDLAISGYDIKNSNKFNILLRKKYNTYIKDKQLFIRVKNNESNIGFKNLLKDIAESMLCIEEIVTISQ